MIKNIRHTGECTENTVQNGGKQKVQANELADLTYRVSGRAGSRTQHFLAHISG